MNKEEKYLMAICAFENAYVEQTKGSRAHEILRNQIENYIYSLKQENKELKKLISTILNWNIFNGECPMNFGYDKNTIEDKSQEVFYQDDDYCENNCNDNYKKCWLKYFRKMQELENGGINVKNS